MPWKDFFNHKRITLMGLGLLGRGIGDATFLSACGAQLLVTDRKSKEELGPALDELKAYKTITYVLGEHRLEDFKNCDMVIKAAGVPLDSPYVAEARKSGVPVYMTTALFAKFAQEVGAMLVGVTGTRGKSTTAHLIHHAIKCAGKRVHLGGNIRGISTLALLPEIQKGDIVVLELDSWQLQGFRDLKISPHIAVFTNLLDDHLDYYNGDLEAYFWDKANIFVYQKSGDRLLVGAQVLSRVQATLPPVQPMVPPPLPSSLRLKLLGEHNRQNAALAAAALRILGLSEDKITTGLQSFEPIEGRLQHLCNIGEVQVYNDNNATTPDATVAALQAFSGKKITLIAGGSDKGLALDEMAQAIADSTAIAVLLPGTGTERLKPLLKTYVEVASMEEAVTKGLDAGNEVLLMSPGFASFGLFKNEYDRSDQFVKAVKK